MNIDPFLNTYVERSRDILKDNLTGIYLHGSAVMGCFNPEKSDLDLIVVVNGPMTDIVKKEYLDMVVEMNASGPAKGIEMSIILKDVCSPFVYPTPFELHFSVGHLDWYRRDPDDYITKMKGTDKDLAAHFTIIKHRGRCLYGAPIADVFAEVPKAAYMDSIYEDIADAAEDISENTMYLTLNLARVLAFQREDLVLSKKEGGEWAVGHIPAEYHSLIKNALKEYVESEPVSYDIKLAKHYAEYMLNEIKAPGVLLETQRLIITEMKPEMAEVVHKNSLDEDTRRFVPDEVFETPEDAAETIEFLITQYLAADGPLVYALITKGDNKNIGYVQLVPIGNGDWEIGYHVAKPYTCKGYATEAVSAFLPVIAAKVGIYKVFAIRLLENAASGRVLEKCGFKSFFTGEGPYHGGIYEIDKSVWETTDHSWN